MKTFIIFMLIFVTVLCHAQENNFRKTRWGMTKIDVRPSETIELVKESENLLIYKTTVDDLDALVVYIFVDGKLVRTKYSFTQKHSDNNLYVNDFETIKTVLTDKYGQPKSVKDYWNNNLYKDDYDSRGMAVAAGHLAKYVDWDLAETGIIQALTGDNFEIKHVVEYQSKRLQGLEEEKKKAKVKSDF